MSQLRKNSELCKALNVYSVGNIVSHRVWNNNSESAIHACTCILKLSNYENEKQMVEVRFLTVGVGITAKQGKKAGMIHVGMSLSY